MGKRLLGRKAKQQKKVYAYEKQNTNDVYVYTICAVKNVLPIEILHSSDRYLENDIIRRNTADLVKKLIHKIAKK